MKQQFKKLFTVLLLSYSLKGSDDLLSFNNIQIKYYNECLNLNKKISETIKEVKEENEEGVSALTWQKYSNQLNQMVVLGEKILMDMKHNALFDDFVQACINEGTSFAHDNLADKLCVLECDNCHRHVYLVPHEHNYKCYGALHIVLKAGQKWQSLNNQSATKE